MFEFDESIVYPNDPSATKERIAQYKEYYPVKYNICKEQNPKVIAEIGVRAGYSAWTFLQACPDAEYIGLDANNGTHGGQGGQDGRYADWAAKILENYNTRLIQVDTQSVNRLDIKNVDLFHVDGDHTSDGVRHDLDLAFRCISKGGLILVDDMSYIPEVRIGVNTWLDIMWRVVTSEFIPSLRGEMLIRKKS